MEWPDGPRLFEHLRDLPAPLRMADVPGYLGSLGLSVSPWGSRTLQGTPMHHRGEHLGNFFLGDKEDGEAFTAEDEEILVLFASQPAIANARTHRDVERGAGRPHEGPHREPARRREHRGGPGLGARFTITIPVAGNTAPEAAPSGGSPRPPGRSRDKTPILVVDDDPETLRYVRCILSDEGYAPLVTGDPEGLSRIIRSERPSLVLLDLILPGTDGIELMKQVPALADLPVIFISGYGRDETIARALESGAADYIVKPFSPTELVARVRAALRDRSEPETFVVGELAVDYGLGRVSVAGRAVPLTATEFDFLRILSLHEGRVVTNETLLRRVWGRRASDDTDRVRTIVKKLRAKLGEDAASPTYIFTEHGVGYRIATPGEA